MAKTSGSLRLPESYDDHPALIALSDKLLDAGRQHRWMIERDWFRNILFFLGRHWITEYPTQRLWLPRATKTPGIPRPVTNKFAEVFRPHVSLLAGEEPNLYFKPSTDQAEDMAAAHVASRGLDVLKQETGLPRLRCALARWIVLTGNAFLVSGYDPTGNGITEIPLQECAGCQAQASPLDIEEAEGHCPACGDLQGWGPARNPETGQPAVRTYPRGKVFTEIAAPFEMYCDLEVGTPDPFQDSWWVIRERTRSRAWVAALYGEEIAEQTPAKSVTGWERGRYFLASLAYATADTGLYFTGVGISNDDRVIVRDIWLRHPTRFPQELHAVQVGDQIVRSAPAEYQDLDATPDTPRPLRPIVHVGYEYAPGRVFYKTPADDVVVKNEYRNKLEAAIQLHVRRMSNAVWLIPEGSTQTKITGEHGIQIRYNPLAGGAAPQRLPGADVAPTLVTYIIRLDEEMEGLAGSVDVLRGETPPRVSAYSALQLLEQRGQQAFSELLVNWGNGHLQWARQTLAIFRQHGVDARFSAALGDNGSWAVEKFSNADLRGAFHIEVEAGLGRPRTAVGKRAVIEQAIRTAALNMMDPQTQFRVLQAYGIPELMPDQQLDQQAAARENDRFNLLDGQVRQAAAAMGSVLGGPQAGGNGNLPVDMAMAFPWPQIKPSLDNHLVHLQIHRRLGVSDRFEAWHPVTQRAFLAHLDAHMFAVMQTFQQVQGQGAPLGGQGAPGPAGGGGEDGEGIEAEAEREGTRAKGERATRTGFAAMAPGGGGGGSVRGA